MSKVVKFSLESAQLCVLGFLFFLFIFWIPIFFLKQAIKAQACKNHNAIQNAIKEKKSTLTRTINFGFSIWSRTMKNV